MSPYRIDPKVDYRRLHELSEEFTALWNRLHAFYLDAAVGFAFVRQYVETNQMHARSYVRGIELDSEEFQDTRLFTYDQIFSDSFVASAIHHATQGEVKTRNVDNGSNFITLGQVCVVSFYDFWNDYLRREYTIATGHLDRTITDSKIIEPQLRKYASHDLWGDIRHLRRSIVHNKGIATPEVGRCKLIKWFQPNDSIALTPAHMRELFLALLKYRNELFAEQFPEHYMQLPSE